MPAEGSEGVALGEGRTPESSERRHLGIGWEVCLQAGDGSRLEMVDEGGGLQLSWGMDFAAVRVASAGGGLPASGPVGPGEVPEKPDGAEVVATAAAVQPFSVEFEVKVRWGGLSFF